MIDIIILSVLVSGLCVAVYFIGQVSTKETPFEQAVAEQRQKWEKEYNTGKSKVDKTHKKTKIKKVKVRKDDSDGHTKIAKEIKHQHENELPDHDESEELTEEQTDWDQTQIVTKSWRPSQHAVSSHKDKRERVKRDLEEAFEQKNDDEFVVEEPLMEMTEMIKSKTFEEVAIASIEEQIEEIRKQSESEKPPKKEDLKEGSKYRKDMKKSSKTSMNEKRDFLDEIEALVQPKPDSPVKFAKREISDPNLERNSKRDSEKAAKKDFDKMIKGFEKNSVKKDSPSKSRKQEVSEPECVEKVVKKMGEDEETIPQLFVMQQAASSSLLTASAVPLQQLAPLPQEKRKKKEKSRVSSLSEDIVGDLLKTIRRSHLGEIDLQQLIDILLNMQNLHGTQSPEEWVANGKKDPLVTIRKKLEESEAKLLEKTTANDGLLSKITDLRADFNTERIKNNTLNKHLATINTQMEKKIEAVNTNHATEIKIKIKEAQALLEKDYQQKFQQQKSVILANADTQLQQLQKAVGESETQIQTLKQKLQDQDNQFSQEQHNRATFLEGEVQQQQQIATILAETQQQLQNVTTNNDDLSQQHQQLQNVIAENQQQLQNVTTNNDDLSQQHQQLQNVIADKQQQLQNITATNEELMLRCQQCSQHIANLEQQQGQNQVSYGNQIADLQTQNSDLQTQNSELQNNYMNAENAKQHTLTQQVSYGSQIAELQTQNGDLQTQNSELQNNYVNADNAKQHTLTQLSQVLNEYDSIKVQLKNLENSRELLSQNKVQLDETLREKSEIESRLRRSDNELSGSREVVKTQMVEIDRLRSENSALASNSIRPPAEGQEEKLENGNTETKSNSISDSSNSKNELKETQEDIYWKKEQQLSSEMTTLNSKVKYLEEEISAQRCKNNRESEKIVGDLEKCKKHLSQMYTVLGDIYPQCRAKETDHDAFVEELIEIACNKPSVEQKPQPTQVVERIVEKIITDPSLQKQIDKLTKENGTLIQKVADLEATLEVESSKVKSLEVSQKEESEVSELKAENRVLGEKLENYLEVLNNTETLLKNLQASVEKEEVKWVAKLAEMEKHLEEVKAEKSNLSAKVGELEDNLEKAKRSEEEDTRLLALREQLLKEELENIKLKEELSNERSQSGKDVATEVCGEDISNGPTNGVECNEDSGSQADSESLFSASSSISEGLTNLSTSKDDNKKKKKKKSFFSKLIG